MGRSHVFSGMAAGAAALPLLSFEHPLHALGFVAVTGAAAIIPDLDHHNSTLTNMWGPITGGLHKALNTLGRGHRGGTHDPVLTPLAGAAVAAVAVTNQWTAMVMLAFILGFGLRAAEFAIPGRTFEKGWLSLGVAVAASAALVLLLDERLWWTVVALPLGMFVHILGDAVTPEGVPTPFTWIKGSKKTLVRGPLTTNTGFEHKLLAPGFLVAAAVFTVIGVPGGIGWDGVAALFDNTTTASAQ